MYVVSFASPVLEYVVAVLPVFATIICQVVPPLVDLSILYPVIAEPPVLDGAVQERLICDDDTAVAVRPVGGCGAVLDVVAEAVFDGGLVPTLLIADTR